MDFNALFKSVRLILITSTQLKNLVAVYAIEGECLETNQYHQASHKHIYQIQNKIAMRTKRTGRSNLFEDGKETFENTNEFKRKIEQIKKDVRYQYSLPFHMKGTGQSES
jgi:predicted DNA-binding protein YlxM (UPF0122 family)